MLNWTFILAFFFNFPNLVGAANKVFVVEIKSGIVSEPQVVKFDAAPSINKNHEIWASESGIICTFGPWSDREIATLECRGPQNYKVQSTFSCKNNKDRESTGYLWVGLEMKVGAHRDFRVYCEDNVKSSKSFFKKFF